MKSYGRAPTFLMATGYEQVRSITAALAGDWDAARDVQLELPETGVCSTTLGARAVVDDPAVRFDAPAAGERPRLVTVGGSGGGCCG
jgi:hypothetical protein